MDREMCEAILDGLFEGIYFVDRDRRITFWNRAAERITGHRREAVLGRACSDGVLCHVDERGARACGAGCLLAATIEDGGRRAGHVFLRHAEGHRVPVRVATVPIVDASGAVVGAAESFFDDGEWRAAVARAEELEAMAFADHLTGVPNRRYLEQRLAAKLEELARYGWPCGALLVDVDRFKEVNDAHGHDVGDAVLRMVARSLQGAMRSFDLVGRWGGEEFLVVVTNATPEVLGAVAERVRALVAASGLREPARIAVTISVGAAAARPGEAIGSLLKRADEALYRAKGLGRNAVWIAEP